MSIIKTHDVIQLKDLNNLEFKLLDVEIENKRFIYRTDLIEDEYIFLTVFKTWSGKFCGKIYLSSNKYWNIEDRKANIRTGAKSSNEDELQPLIEKLAPFNLERSKAMQCAEDKNFFKVYLSNVTMSLSDVFPWYVGKRLLPSVDGVHINSSNVRACYCFLRDVIEADLKSVFYRFTDYDDLVKNYKQTVYNLIPVVMDGTVDWLIKYFTDNKQKLVKRAEETKNLTYL